MKYRKKPVVIEAIQWTGNNIEELKDFVGDCIECDIVEKNIVNGIEICRYLIKIYTLEGVMICSDGDFVIKGVDGEFYPCKQDIFRKTYEAVSD